MTKELAERVGEPGDIDLLKTGFTYKTLQAISQTDFIPKGLRGNVPAILACVMAGKEMGLPPMEALNKIDVIDGRPSPSAELMVAMVYRSGHEVYPGDISEESATAIGVRFLPDGEKREHSFTFTMEDARRAGLGGKKNWKTYPGPMLYWRAVSQLIRMVFPDVMSAFKAYTGDELGEDDWTPPDPGTMAVAEDGHEDIAEAVVVESESGGVTTFDLEVESPEDKDDATRPFTKEDETPTKPASTEPGNPTEELQFLLRSAPPKDKGTACDWYERVCDLMHTEAGGDPDVAFKGLDAWRKYEYKMAREHPGEGYHGAIPEATRLSVWKAPVVKAYLKWWAPLAAKQVEEALDGEA